MKFVLQTRAILKILLTQSEIIMSYGKVINGGASMRKGVTKGINDKIAGHSGENARREQVASAVRSAYTVNTVSSQHTNGVKNSGKFTKPSNTSKNYAL
jgi:hypothetical protein